MAWPVGPLPPPGGVDNPLVLYQWARQFPDAILERFRVRYGGDWPKSTKGFVTGRITSIVVDPVDNTKLRITCEIWNGSAWVSPDWVSARHPGDGSGTKWWHDYSTPPDDFRYEPAFYKVVVRPKTICSDGSSYPIHSEPSRSHAFHIEDNGDNYFVVKNDGVLTLNGKALTDYATGYEFLVHRSGGINAMQAGYASFMRFPPRPNGDAYAWGYNGKLVTVTVTSMIDFTLTIGGTPTAPITVPATAGDIYAAIVAIGVDPNKVGVFGPGPFDVVFHPDIGDISFTGTGATITVPNNKIGDLRRSWTDDQFNGMDIIFANSNGRWFRTPITDGIRNIQAFTSVGSVPEIGGYYVIVNSGDFWRPHFFAGPGTGDLGGGIAEFPAWRVDLTDRKTWTGTHKVWEKYNFWHPLMTFSTLARRYLKSHHPISDDPQDYLVPKVTQFISECPTNGECGDCDAYEPDGPGRDIDVMDNDATTLAENYCTDYADWMISPWMYWSPRGWQDAIYELVPSFLAPIDYTGKEAIPDYVIATWWKYHKPATTRTTTITAVTGGGVATFSAVTMPQITPLAGNYTQLKVYYAVLDSKGNITKSGTGTLTSTTLTRNDAGVFDSGDEGKTLVVAFGWTRKYERFVRYLYFRCAFMPEENDDFDFQFPPTEQFPGEYLSVKPSAKYCEFDEYGLLNDTSENLITGESARYLGDPWDAPTGRGEYEDLLYQGKNANADSTFPVMSKSGLITAGGLGWARTDGLFWASTNPLVLHQTTGGTGSSATEIHFQSEYKLWPTIVDGSVEMQLRLSRYWTSMGGQRFVDADGTNGLIAECAVSGAGTVGDPYVWEKAPIVSQNTADPTNPYITVSTGFSGTTYNRPVQIREPGYTGRGAIRNWGLGKPFTILHADGTRETVKITHSDDDTVWWNPASGISAADGDAFLIDEIEAGSVVQRRPAHAEAWHNGYVRPEFAVQDTRGHDWFIGKDGVTRNCPTIVTNYGLLRKRDIGTIELWDEMYTGLNAIKHYGRGHDWDNLGLDNVRSVGDQDASWDNVNGPNYATAVGSFSDGHAYFWGNVGTHYYPDDIEPTTTAVVNELAAGGSAPPRATVDYTAAGGPGWPDTGNLHMNERSALFFYGKLTLIPDCLATAIDLYAYGTKDAADNNEVNTPITGGGFTKRLFDPMGTPLQFRKWAKWGSIAASIGATRTTASPLGSLSAPPVPTAGPNPQADGSGAWSYANGWYAYNKKAIVKGDVPGGLIHVA